MNYSIEILFAICFLFHQSSEEDILFINQPGNVHYKPYQILPTNARFKRDQTSLFSQSIEHCDQHIYTKLYSCSHLNDCTAFASCLQSIHCPINVKSHGSLILNLLHLLGIHNCDRNSSCAHEKRVEILHDLLTHWTDSKLTQNTDYPEGDRVEQENYCQTISKFLNEVKEEIKDQCSDYFRQVEFFLENYSCSGIPVDSLLTTTKTNLDWSKLDDLLRKVSTISSQIHYFDDDEDLNKHLLNTTDQTVYVNDHQYYNVSYIIPKFEGIPLYFADDNQQFGRIDALADQHRSAFNINLRFDFPFYGHSIKKILIGTGGFIYTGDLMHSAVIGSTQYIAPFMANFDVSIGGNQSEIKYLDNSTHFICTWKNLYLQDQQEAGPFTFQVILQNTGNIYFNYIRIPQVNISNLNHAHRLGLSDAYMSQHTTNEHIIRVITLYDKLNLDREKIKNGVSIVFYMDNTCNTFADCMTCLANRGKRYNCSWCDDIQKCSDGYDRSRHQWMKAQCHRFASEETCPNSHEESYDHHRFLPSTSSSSSPMIHSNKIQPYTSARRHSTLATFRTIVVTLLITVLILSLIAFLGTYIYAYRHPTSPPGMWLLEHRPSNYIARFKRFSGSNNDSI